MSCLIHPVGWRLYFTRYWKFNFFIRKGVYPLHSLKFKLLAAVVESVLQKTNSVYNERKNILTFSSYSFFNVTDQVYLLIRYKFHWKNLLQDLMNSPNISKFYRKYFHRFKYTNLLLRALFKRKFIFFSKKALFF